MALRTPRSLHLRLWIVIALASLPVFLMAFLDYRERRQDAITSLENEVSRMLIAARLAEESALRRIRQTFQIMARADNLQSLDTDDCSGLAQRLLQSMEGVSNIGAALPNGQLFCSACPMRGCWWSTAMSTTTSVSACRPAACRPRRWNCARPATPRCRR